MNTVLVLGRDGMLGHDVYKYLSAKEDINLLGTTMYDLNCTTFYDISNYFTNHPDIDVVVNCTAFTNTAACEQNEGNVLSYKLNAMLPLWLTAIHKSRKESGKDLKIIHISTDYVFSEYADYPVEFPINTYGLHKLLGEKYFKPVVDAGDGVILRTSWLYGQWNKKSFIHKFIANMDKIECNNKETGMHDKPMCVDDQFSVPTSTKLVSQIIYNAIHYKLTGLINAICSLNGEKVSKYDFANEIFKYVIDEYTTFSEIETTKTTCNGSMRWPKWSVLPDMCHNKVVFDGIELTYWKDCLRDFMENEFEK